MNKPYGYKKGDLIALSEFIEKGGFCGKSLTGGFKAYAEVSGKATGSVRNLYYALAKYSAEDKDFTDKYLNGKPISVSKNEKFSREEKDVMDKISEYVKLGMSVRKATISLADGDAKKALRFQNKFRANARAEKRVINGSGDKTGNRPVVGAKNNLIEKLKKEIDMLADRLSLSLKRENAALKREIIVLKAENARLYKRLNPKTKGALDYFSLAQGADISQIHRR